MLTTARILLRQLREEHKLAAFARQGPLRHATEDRSTKRPIFLMATPAAGTTWVGAILGNLEGYTYVHEVKLYRGRSRVLLDLLRDRPIPGRARAGYLLFEAALKARLTTLRSHAAYMKTRPELLSDGNLGGLDLDDVAACWDADTVDSSGGTVFVAPLLRAAYPRSVMCFMVRDPRDVVLSIVHRKPFGEVKDLAGWARDVVYHYEAYEQYRDSCAIDLIRYEDWVADTRGELAAFIARHELPAPSPAELDEIVLRHSAEAMRSGKVPKLGNLSRGVAGAWRATITPEEKAVIKPILEDMLVRLGYEQDHDW